MIYSFGTFQLDALSRRLLRGGEPLAVPDRQIAVLLRLVSQPGQILSKDALIAAAWDDVAVTDNSLEQAISALRRTLGSPPGATAYIETLARRGYRFGVAVTATTRRYSGTELEAMLAPHRAFVEGRTALETLGREEVLRARGVFESVIRVSPDYAPAHVGMANALALHFESTRTGSMPDREALTRAVDHAAEACRLDPSSGEAWATLGLVSHQSRDRGGAIAAVRRAVALEPENWRHQVRLAFVSWGEQRLRAAQRAQQLFPDFALAHWLAASVYIARQTYAQAEHELLAGAAAQDRQRQGGKFKAAGLHLLLGLVRLATGDDASAIREFDLELGFENAAQIYTREACANTWCAIGAVRLRSGDTGAAITAFARALEAVPGHPVALAAHCGLAADPALRAIFERRIQELRVRGAAVEAAFAEATLATVCGDPAGAARLLHATIAAAPPGSDAWTVPVDPLLRVACCPQHWADVMTLLRNRAA